MEFGSPVMLRVTDKPQGGLMQERWIEGIWLGSRFNTLEHLVSRRSDGVVVRTRAVREIPRTVQKSGLDSIVGQPHAPQGVQRIEKFEVPRACVAPPTEPAVPTSGPDPLRPVPRAVYITKAMLEKHGYTANCGKCRAIQRGQSQTTVGHTTECRKRMEELLGNDMVYQHRLEQANERVNHYLAEELEIVDKKRKLNPSKTAIDESTPDPNNTDQDMADINPQGIGESSSSTDGVPPSTETGDQVAEGTKRKAEDQLLPDALDRCEQPERGDEIPVPEASSSVSPSSREIKTEDTLARPGLKRPQEDDADGEEHPPARKARLEALCSLVHGDLGRPEQTLKDRSETDGLISAVMCRSSSGKQNSTDSHLTEAHSEWDVSWTPWWSYNVCKQVPGLSIARSLISRAATLRSSGKKFKVMLLDVTAAFLYGFSERPLFMEIPKEDPASERDQRSSRGLLESEYRS